MSKVIHLPESAHKKAKKFCTKHGIRMSDWVNTLVNEATTQSQKAAVAEPEPPKKKILQKLEDKPESSLQWEKKPFWNGRRK